MSTTSHHTQSTQRKVVTTLLVITALIVVIAVPLVLSNSLRLDVAHRLGLAPGRGAEQIADGDDGASLVVIPLGNDAGSGQRRYQYKAQYIARPTEAGTELTDIESGTVLTIPLKELEFVAANADGAHVLFRGPDAGSGDEIAFLVDTARQSAERLPQGQDAPEIDGDWDTPVWAKTQGPCDRYSPGKKFVACFNRADAASYLAGDWQIDIQLYGNYEVSEPVYRGAGFLPILGWAHQDTWIYFQNELGIWRIEIPENLQSQT